MLPTDLPPTLRPLYRDLEQVRQETFDPAELTRHGQLICQQLQTLAIGHALPPAVLGKLREAAINFFPAVPASEAVAAAAATALLYQDLSPHRESIHFLPLQVVITRLTRIQRARNLGATDKEGETQITTLLAWLADCLRQYETRSETLPAHLWDKLHRELCQLDPAGTLTESARSLLIRLTPTMGGRLPQPHGPGGSSQPPPPNIVPPPPFDQPRRGR